jgi:integrase
VSIPLILERIINSRAELYRGLRESGLSGQSCLHVHRALHRALNYGIKPLHVLTENVTDDVPAPRPPERTMKPIDELTVRMLVEVAKGTRLETLVQIAAVTGLRRGEILALRWCNVSFERGRLAVTESLEQTRALGVRFKAPKSRSSQRVIPFIGRSADDSARTQGAPG